MVKGLDHRLQRQPERSFLVPLAPGSRDFPVASIEWKQRQLRVCLGGDIDAASCVEFLDELEHPVVKGRIFNQHVPPVFFTE